MTPRSVHDGLPALRFMLMYDSWGRGLVSFCLWDEQRESALGWPSPSHQALQEMIQMVLNCILGLCIYRSRLRTDFSWELWLADDHLLFVPSGSAPGHAQGPLQTLTQQGPNNFCPRPVMPKGQALLWSTPFVLAEALSVCIVVGGPLPTPCPILFRVFLPQMFLLNKALPF